MRTSSVVVLCAVFAVGFACGGGVSSQEAPDAVSADPQHYSVAFENDVVRVLQVRYALGETSAMHRHPANCAVFLGASSTQFELPSGEIVDASFEAGQVQCGDAEVHLPTNTGDTPVEVVLVELKGRDTFAQ
jgi:hypothetical protein